MSWQTWNIFPFFLFLFFSCCFPLICIWEWYIFYIHDFSHSIRIVSYPFFLFSGVEGTPASRRNRMLCTYMYEQYTKYGGLYAAAIIIIIAQHIGGALPLRHIIWILFSVPSHPYIHSAISSRLCYCLICIMCYAMLYSLPFRLSALRAVSAATAYKKHWLFLFHSNSHNIHNNMKIILFDRWHAQGERHYHI